jgi:hypothetical protein
MVQTAIKLNFVAGENDHVKPLKMGDIRMNFRRLSKMVLGGYGGASLLFFGVPFPGQQPPTEDQKNADTEGKSPKINPDTNVAQGEEEVLAQLVHDGDDEEITAGSSALPHSRDVSAHLRYPMPTSPVHSPTPTRNSSRLGIYPNSPGPRAGGVPFPSVSTTNLHSPAHAHPVIGSPTESVSTVQGEDLTITARPVPSWWEMLTGQRDREIFEGFASAAIAAGEIKAGAKEARKELKRGQYRPSMQRREL